MTPRRAFHASSFVLKMKSSVLLWFAGYSNNNYYYWYMMVSSVMQNTQIKNTRDKSIPANPWRPPNVHMLIMRENWPALMSNTITLIWTIICDWRSVHFTQTVIVAYGPLFAVEGPYAVSHRPSFLLSQSKYRACISLSHLHSCLWTAIGDWLTDGHPWLRTVICGWQSI